MIAGQSVCVRFAADEHDPEFLARGTIRDVRDEVVLVEFPPVNEGAIRESDDPEIDDAEWYVLRCFQHQAHGRVWFARGRIVEDVP